MRTQTSFPDSSNDLSVCKISSLYKRCQARPFEASSETIDFASKQSLKGRGTTISAGNTGDKTGVDTFQESECCSSWDC
jgi:hypothetical protein